MLLITLGDLSLDIVIAPEAPIAKGSDIGGTIAFRVGGSAANVARVAASLGCDTVFVGAVGDDRLGKRLVAALGSEGVRPVIRFVRDIPTARIAVLLGADGERSFVTVRGAADHLTPAAVKDIVLPIGQPAFTIGLHLPMYSLMSEPLASAAIAAVGAVRPIGGLVSVDLGSAEPLRMFGQDRARGALESVAPDLLFANEDEADALGGRLEYLSPHVVIKQGSRGCLVDDEAVPTEPLAVEDTTGAGDAFDAGFLVALLGDQPRSLIEAARAGHAAAAAFLTASRPELSL